MELPDIKIGDNCFLKCDKLTEITIPPTISSIGKCAFYECQNLVKITIPSSVKSIGEKAFIYCDSLKEIIIPPSVESIGDLIVSGCTKLTKIIIPSSVEKIGKLDFHYFRNLTEFIIPSSVTIINEGAFYKCESLVKIEIPSSVTDIEKYAFRSCTSLKEIIIPPSINSIELKAFCDCISLVNITIPSTIKSIGFNAFKGCASLKKINFVPFIQENIDKIDILTDIPDIRILLVGPSYIGKSSILLRYIDDTFKEDVPQTFVSSTRMKNIVYNGFIIKLTIFDVTFSYRFIEGLKLFYGVDCVIVAFDLTCNEPFDYIKGIFDDVHEKIKNNNLTTILLGTKCDLNHKVRDEQIKEIIMKYKTKYFEVSAKDDVNINSLFEFVISETVKKILTEKDRLKSLFIGNQKKCNIF